MKWNLLIIFLFLSLTLAHAEAQDKAMLTLLTAPTTSDAQKGKILFKMLRDHIREQRKGKVEYLYEERTKSVPGCSHCPKYFDLTQSVNKVVEAMKNDPKYQENEELPVSLNRLKFLYFTVLSRNQDGTVKCDRFMDINPDLKKTEFDGQMKLLAEDVYKFDGISTIQVIDSNKEEIVYYYRGEGGQKNLIVQAILNRDGGTFRYFRFIPSQEASDPYDLPVLSEADLSPKEREQLKKMSAEIVKSVETKTEIISTEELKISELITPPSKDKMNVGLNSDVGKKIMSLQSNAEIAKADISQGFLGTGLRVNAKSVLSLKGNDASANIQNENGENYVELNVKTSLSGKTERKIAIPYSIRLGSVEDADALSLKGKAEDGSKNQIVTLQLTDRFTQYIRAELKRDKETHITSYAVAKDFSIGKAESMTVIAGKNEANKTFGAIQHRKVIKDNVTMVLDVRLDESRKASFFYQMNARF